MFKILKKEDSENLVFIDEDGMIVGKSTLYINREEGYGVFNNVEINNDIPILELRPIYKKYKEAIERFAVHYNKENPDKPLKKINVGFSHNDLNFYIMNSDKKEKDDNLLIAPDYSIFFPRIWTLFRRFFFCSIYNVVKRR